LGFGEFLSGLGYDEIFYFVYVAPFIGKLSILYRIIAILFVLCMIIIY